MRNFIVFLLTLTTVVEMPFRAFAGYEAEKLSVYPLLKTISLLEKYKDRPDELFVSGELKNHEYSLLTAKYFLSGIIQNSLTLKKQWKKF